MDLVFRTKKKTSAAVTNGGVREQRLSPERPKSSIAGGIKSTTRTVLAAFVLVLPMGLFLLRGRPEEGLTSFSATKIPTLTCPTNLTTSSTLQQLWSDIDQQVSKFPKTRVSGGIFLYPRQAALLKTLVELLAKQSTQPLTICETGFGAGHSAALFMETISPPLQLYMFDKFDRPYQLPALQLLQKRYPHHKSQHVAGDSCQTVPQQLSSGTIQCDMLHASSLCPTDNIDLVEHSPCGVLLTTTAMNSLEDNVVYFGPKGQWTQLQQRGCIRDITCFEEEHRKLDRTYIFNKDGATISHKFCFAITTGECQKEEEKTRCDGDMARFTQQLELTQLCKEYQVAIPKQ